MSNPRQRTIPIFVRMGRTALVTACALTSSLGWAAAAPVADSPWQAMDYGPFLTATIEAPEPRTNIAFKGVAINLGANFGGEHNEAVIFDTDLLRYSAGWTGDFVALKGVVFDGEHWAYPHIAGPQVFGNPSAPGWASGGKFNDPRAAPYGPLPREWAHWQGLYLHGQQVVLAYSIGAMSVLEMPALERSGQSTAFVRTLNLSPSAVENILQLAFDSKRRAELLSRDGLKTVGSETPAAKSFALLALPAGTKSPSAAARSTDAGLVGSTPSENLLAVALVGGPDTARWITTDDGHLRLRLAANAQPTHCKVLLWSGPRAALPEFAALVQSSPPPADLEPLTHGGPPRWPEKLVTHGSLGTNDGPYAIDTLTEPDANPWRSWMRFGGLDFFPDGKRAALSTWNGDVWVVSGVDGDLRNLTWQRIATGLFQPLGLRIVDEQIYVLGRDQITRLHDRNGDGEADFYENFNNDCMVSEHFHEFALDLKTGPDGSFYYIKCACHGTTAKHPHHGTLMKVSKDGAKLEVVARGFRANNGLGVGPRGELTSIDNQGHWMPGNRINWIKPGGWYGYQWAWNPEGRTNYDEPLCWMHNFVDRSGGTQLWVPTDQWGPFRDELITISYGMGHIFRLLKEEVDGRMQGAVTRLPLEFETGAMRGAWHPQNGQLYTAGLYGWAGNKTRAGGFYRVRYTGKPVHMANALHFVRDGIVLGFTDPLDEKSATDPGNYNLTAWNYKWTADYGSPDFKLNGQEGRDPWPVESATLSADRKTVFLKVPDAQRVMQLHLVFNLLFADGAKVENFVHGTIHKLAAKSGRDWLGAGAIARNEPAQLRLAHEAPGLIQTFTRATDTSRPDVRQARLAALWVPAGTAPTTFLDAGPFRCRWEGFLKLELNDAITFEMDGRGAAALKINGEVVLDARDRKLSGVRSQPVSLRSGLNRFELDYQSPASGDAEFRLAWSSKRMPPEPVPATAFVHDATDPALLKRELARTGRALFAEHRCANCHKPPMPWSPAAMPELAADAPAFDDVGNRLRASWIAQWLLDPKAIRPDARMPRMLSGQSAETDARDIAAYFASLRTAIGPPAETPGAVASRTNQVVEGAKLFADLGCVACHSLPGEMALSNDTRVPLNSVAAKWQPAAFAAFLRAPATHFRWTRMPDFKLATNEAAALAAFVFERAQKDPRWPSTGRVEAGDRPADARRGGELVTTLGCLSCHRLDKSLDQSHAPTLASLSAGNWTQGCVGDDAAARGRSPEFGFDAAQRTALRAFAQNGFPDALHRDVAAEFAGRQYTALRCNACHPRDTETDLLTRLAAAAPRAKPRDDEEEFAGGGGSIHVGRPLLTFAGEKLYAGWMQRFLDGTLRYKPRPELQGRMPAFPAYAEGLAAGLAQQHGYAAESAPTLPVDLQLAAIGQRLTLVNGGFSCVSCHNVGDQKALAGKDTATINFTSVAERLRPTYYWRYVQDPTRLVPSTMMPKFIGDDGTTPIKAVFDGDPQQQFNAIWHYLMSLRTEAPAK